MEEKSIQRFYQTVDECVGVNLAPSNVEDVKSTVKLSEHFTVIITEPAVWELRAAISATAGMFGVNSDTASKH